MKSSQLVPTNIDDVLSEVKKLRAEFGRPHKRLLSVDEAATYLGISPKTIRNGLGPKAQRPFPVKPVRVASRVLFPIERLDQYVDQLLGLESAQ